MFDGPATFYPKNENKADTTPRNFEYATSYANTEENEIISYPVSEKDDQLTLPKPEFDSYLIEKFEKKYQEREEKFMDEINDLKLQLESKSKPSFSLNINNKDKIKHMELAKVQK